MADFIKNISRDMKALGFEDGSGDSVEGADWQTGQQNLQPVSDRSESILSITGQVFIRIASCF